MLEPFKLVATNMNHQNVPVKPWYTPAEFAALFGMERTWAYRQLNQGKILAITGYGRTRIAHSEVERVIKDNSRYLGWKRKRKEARGKEGEA